MTVPTRITKPAVFRLQVVQFMDAAALKFTVQHPLWDAKGLYKIVSGYCDLLAGKQIQALDPRSTLEVVKEDDATERTLSGDTISDEDFIKAADANSQAKPGDEYYSKGWGPFLKSGVSQWSRKATSEQRVRNAVLVPLAVMALWRAVADSLGVRVSRNDLLMAWIYMCSIPKAGNAPLRYTFVLNVESFLHVTGDLHNTWCLVPVRNVPEDLLNRIRSNPSRIHALIMMAEYFRDTIENARSPAFMAQTFKDYSDAPVISPKDFGKPEPNLRISSWSYINLWELKFFSGPLPYGAPSKVITARWLSGNKDFCPALVWVNLTCDDTIVTWNEDRGYWIQGRLYLDTWERIAQSSTAVLIDQTRQDNVSS